MAAFQPYPVERNPLGIPGQIRNPVTGVWSTPPPGPGPSGSGQQGVLQSQLYEQAQGSVPATQVSSQIASQQSQTQAEAARRAEQQAQAAAAAAAQRQAEQATAALQTAGFTGQSNLQTSAQQAAATQQGADLAAAQQRQAEAEAAAAAAQQAGFAGSSVMSAQEAAQQQAQTRLQSQLAQQAWQQRLSALPGVFASFGGAQPTIQYGGGTGPADLEAARAAAFARAKDTTGQVTESALRGLRESLAGRGALGAGLEAGATQQLLSGGAQNLSDVVREQAIQDYLAQQHAADVQYQGGITQRGQNLAQMQALLGLLSSGPLY